MRGSDLGQTLSLPANVTAQGAISKLASLSPMPTNAIALAILDALPQHPTSTEATAAGVPQQLAEAFLPPRGIFPWMRLIAHGYNDGQMRDPSDSEWYLSPYPLNLYEPAGTWADIMAGSNATGFSWDEQLAEGNSAAVAQSLVASASELQDIVEKEACPKFIVPRVRGMPPTPNPQCWGPDIDRAKRSLRDYVDKLHGGSSSGTSFLFWIAVGYLVIRGRL
jgi:hypothetical protein